VYSELPSEAFLLPRLATLSLHSFASRRGAATHVVASHAFAMTAASSPADVRMTRMMIPSREYAALIVSGAVAGCAVEAAFYPLDTIKTRAQASRGRALVSAPLFRGVYKGLGGNLLGAAPASALFFAAYEPARRGMMTEDGGDGGVVARLAAGSFAGLVSSIARVPTEVIKTRRQVGSAKASSVRAIIASHGVSGLFVGYGSFLLRDLPFDAIEFALYESMKEWWREFNSGKDVRGVEAAAIGAVAGAVTGAATTPLDVVKTRLMTNPEAYRGIVDCVRTMVKEEGAMSMFKGVQPRMVWIGLGGGCFFSVLESARAFFIPLFAAKDARVRT